jgi:hypothetical protein
METHDERLRRWLDSDPSEIFGWMTVWAQNALPPQITTLARPNFEESLFLLTHAFMQAFMESVFDLRGRAATETYLKLFVDGRKKHERFSLVILEIHAMRNVMAHQVYSSLTHQIAFDYQMKMGWAKPAGLLRINPVIYAGWYVDGLASRLRRWRKLVPRLKQVRQKYKYIARWLGLSKADPLNQQIIHLCSLPSLTALRPAERKLRKTFRTRYNI